MSKRKGTGHHSILPEGGESPRTVRKGRRSRSFRTVLIGITMLGAVIASGIFWLSHCVNEMKQELTSASTLVPAFKTQLLKKDESSAAGTLHDMQSHIDAAQSVATDPVWRAAGYLPWVGPNFSALSELATSARDMVNGAGKPLIQVFASVDWDSLIPSQGQQDLAQLSAVAPSIESSAATVEATWSRLNAIDRGVLMPQVAEPIRETVHTLEGLREPLRTASNAAKLLPTMMGSERPRHYLVLVQNSAEVRATGGLPGALILLSVSNGKVELVQQTSGSAMRKFLPPIDVASEQTSIYSTRLGSYISDVNLTPDFPTVAKTSKAMWEKRFGGTLDGVLAADPVVLKHMLAATGPVELKEAALAAAADLPTTLTSTNVVPTLLSEVYTKLDSNDDQDAYFAEAAHAVFSKLTAAGATGQAVLEALILSNEENRLRVWSGHSSEQAVLGRISLGGSVSGPAVGGASFGVYFNDGTGAKMDYYVRREVELVQECPGDGYSQFTVKVRLHNIAPADAGTALPPAVTGGGRFGTSPGSVRTNTVVYGPDQGLVDTVLQDGKQVSFGSHLHGQRPVGILSTKLAPGASTEMEFRFVKVVQATQPTLAVTPTIQAATDVALPVTVAKCPS